MRFPLVQPTSCLLGRVRWATFGEEEEEGGRKEEEEEEAEEEYDADVDDADVDDERGE